MLREFGFMQKIELTQEQSDTLDSVVIAIKARDTKHLISNMYISYADITNNKLNNLFTVILFSEEKLPLKYEIMLEDSIREFLPASPEFIYRPECLSKQGICIY